MTSTRKFPRKSPLQRENGVAIVIVLSFVVLLSGLVVAFLSKSLTEQQVSSASVSQAKADNLAQAAVSIITGDLKEEIRLGSQPQSGPPFLPKIPENRINAVPKRLSLENTTFDNLIRVSRYNDTALTVSSKASNAISTAVSQNGRSISINRWNAPYLLGATAPSSTNFKAPDWVYVTGEGPAVLVSPTNTVTGRYAYAIYDEGGLLDINVAGGPSTATTAQVAFKTASSYADLTQIGLSASQVDQIVGWRNNDSANAGDTFGSYTPDAADYNSAVTTATNGFMTSLGTGDQKFTSRQALIQFWKDSFPAAALDPLQYLGTFSRTINFASYTPSEHRPAPDDTVNQKFSNLTVGTAFQRIDGTQAEVGDPLVKRFPLSRIKWLTNGAPAAPTSSTILAAFGLTGGGHSWSYPGTEIKKLSTVASENREANFFELLKAAITKGSLGKTATGTGYQHDLDADIDHAIIQIGANIIDQYDTDGYPTKITFNGRDLYGSEDLPYLYRTRANFVVKDLPNPVTTTGAEVTWTQPSDLANAGSVVGLLQPEIWKPYVAAHASTGGPTNFRFVVYGRLPTSTGATDPVALHVEDGGNVRPEDSNPDTAKSNYDNPIDGLTGPNPPSPTTVQMDGSSMISFTDTGALFRAPTVLDTPGGDANVVLTAPSPISAITGGVNGSVGICFGAAPLRWVIEDTATATHKIRSAVRFVVDITNNSGALNGMTCHLEYRDTGGDWVSYDQKFAPVFGLYGAVQDVNWGAGSSFGLDQIKTWAFSFDPRTSRFGMPVVQLNSAASNPAAPVAGTLETPSIPRVTGAAGGAGWNPEDWTAASISPSTIAANKHGSTTYYSDPDGIVRRAMGGYNATPLDSTTTAATARPVILNRPFESVADLGYVFSGIPWRNLDFSTPESGFSALLDVFCLNEVNNPVDSKGLIAGRVNLNTRQKPVLKAILTGAIQNELDGVALDAGAAETIATALTGRTETKPLLNLADLVGGCVSTSDIGGSNINGADASLFDGFSADLTETVGRKRETAIRALANAGQTRVWNLMIDIVAQPGRFPPAATNLDKFTVEGEQRYWVHLAIDRYTGKVIDRQIEVVKE